MPYIAPEQREALKIRLPATAAELCYDLTKEVVQATEGVDLFTSFQTHFRTYIARVPKEELGWKNYADVMAAVTGAAAEVARRGHANKYAHALEELLDAFSNYYETVIGPYEDEKIKLNGDIFP